MVENIKTVQLRALGESEQAQVADMLLRRQFRTCQSTNYRVTGSHRVKVNRAIMRLDYSRFAKR